MTLHIRPLTLRQANALVASWHRHHQPVVGHRFSLGAYQDERICGAAIVGRPVARAFDPYRVAEVTRLVTDGTPQACSFLYGACARVAREMGFERIQTYILSTESGISLRASGWTREITTADGEWNRPSRRRHVRPGLLQPKIRWAKIFQ